MPQVSPHEWDAFIDRHPEAHLLQTRAWGELKSAFGWQAGYVLNQLHDLGAQVLFRRLPLGLSLAYIPKGPVGGAALDTVAGCGSDGDVWQAIWAEVDRMCLERRAVFLKVEPDAWATAQVDANQVPSGFRPSQQEIQPRRTLLVDLGGSEEAVLGRMKQKTRYNIRLAQKRGVLVHRTADLEAFYRLMQITGERDVFGVHSLGYYRRAYELFHPRGECELLLAELDGEPLGGLMVFAHGRRAWYFYGASSDQHRETMPTYLLQWEAMRWARGRGCANYDLWGVPDFDEHTLEAQFTERSDGLWGVYRFKRGFGGQLLRACGPWDRVYRPLGYALYRLGLRFRPGGAG
jgi:lipid II:glycine glycyltransferase (peptidoglycan interpeptide bridge formation enzyme)